MQGAGAARVDAAAPAEELVLVTIGSAKRDADLVDQIASLGPRLTNLPISILSIDSLPAVDVASTEETRESSSVVPPEAGDPALHALMFGRYTGQISARIERAWIRPRSPVNESAPAGGTPVSSPPNEPQFKCRVQIRQDERGNVQEVSLIECNGTEAWRQSLVVAINQSSPLPAPPIPSVFTRTVTMIFAAEGYQPGSPSDGYESERSADATRVIATRASGSSAPKNPVRPIRAAASR
jgi:hypothetical protein